MESIDVIFRSKDGAQQLGLSCVKPPFLSAKESADSIYQKSQHTLPFLPKLQKITKRGLINWAGKQIPYYIGKCLLPTGQVVEALIAGMNNEKRHMTVFFFWI
jgi:hypothetical protein